MSTTPMQRPFLVGQVLDHVDQTPTRHDPAYSGFARKGLYLLPASGNRKLPATHRPDPYKIVAAAAALFLVLTI